jgi:hypothetical protein
MDRRSGDIPPFERASQLAVCIKDANEHVKRVRFCNLDGNVVQFLETDESVNPCSLFRFVWNTAQQPLAPKEVVVKRNRLVNIDLIFGVVVFATAAVAAIVTHCGFG